ncbi:MULTISPECIES: LIM domain-containing protein [unclassified Salmonella]|uniref:LIM domain-containing protein n=1 Tax=unclassified Salmonella TaxID=2614656 RepID=UPI0037544652
MSETCPCCDNPVFSAEKACISGKNGEVWHKHCLKCCECSKMLDSVTFNEHQGQIYCKNHYARHHGAKGFRGGQSGSTCPYSE